MFFPLWSPIWCYSYIPDMPEFTLKDAQWAYSCLEVTAKHVGGCLIYSTPGKYHYFHRTTKPGGVYVGENAHRLALMIKLGTVDVPESLEASHLCHEPACVKLAHLEAEPKELNDQRKTCNEEKCCMGHLPAPVVILANYFQ